MDKRDIQLVDLPAKVVVECTGFSLDIGGSVIKLVYRTKEDYEEAKSKKDDQTSTVRMVSFGRQEVPEAVQFIKDHVYITRDGASDELTPVFTTGVGCSQYGQLIKDELQCKTNNLAEFDCFSFVFGYLAKRLTREQLLYPLIEEATRLPLEMLKDAVDKFAHLMNAGLSKGTYTVDTSGLDKSLEKKLEVEPSKRPVAEAESIYPCLLAMCGSGFAYMKLEEDGKFQIVDGSNRGGRAFLGLGSLLTGCKDYDELIDLASRGNTKNVDTNVNDIMTMDGGDDLYSQFGNDKYNKVVYGFGKAVGASPGDFCREDLAAALLHFMTLDISQNIFLTARVHEVKHVFFCGSFINTATVRAQLTSRFTARNAFTFTIKGKVCS